MLRLDIATKKLSELPMMNETRYHHSSAIADNILAVFAGHSGYELMSTIEMIDLAKDNAWHAFASQSFSARMNPVVSTVGPSLILVCGGCLRDGEQLKDVMLFDTKSHTVRKLFEAEKPFDNGRNN